MLRDCPSERHEGPTAGTSSLTDLMLCKWVCGAVSFVLAGACGDLPNVAPNALPVPVIQMLLMSGAPTQVASVEYGTAAESLVVRLPRPIAADSVALAIEDDDGAGAPLEPIPDVPGHFRANLLVVPGATYRLMGQVAGRRIDARVTVPGPLIVHEPADDTLRLPFQAIVSVPYAWQADGAAAYTVDWLDSVPGKYVLFHRDTSGVFHLSPESAGRGDTIEVVIWAWDPWAAEFFAFREGDDPRQGNISGALGVFGAATPADKPKVVIWQ